MSTRLVFGRDVAPKANPMEPGEFDSRDEIRCPVCGHIEMAHGMDDDGEEHVDCSSCGTDYVVHVAITKNITSPEPGERRPS